MEEAHGPRLNEQGDYAWECLLRGKRDVQYGVDLGGDELSLLPLPEHAGGHVDGTGVVQALGALAGDGLAAGGRVGRAVALRHEGQHALPRRRARGRRPAQHRGQHLERGEKQGRVSTVDGWEVTARDP